VGMGTQLHPEQAHTRCWLCQAVCYELGVGVWCSWHHIRDKHINY
jgi:hypothetical protein